MISKAWSIFTAIGALAAPNWACAADAPQACQAQAALPAELATWAAPVAREAAGEAAVLTQAALVIGQAANVTLLQTPTVTYPLRPEKPGGSVSYGGLLQVVVATRGTYRVALGSAAWIDLVTAGGAAVDSVAHGHGPACSGIHKMVDFVLEPGAYTLQISANGSPMSEVLVIRQP